MSTNPIEYAQNTFDSAYTEAITAKKRLSIRSLLRRSIAYSLKAVAVFGGIAVASGRFSSDAQNIGIAIIVAVAIDGLFSNHIQTMLVTKAANAYDRITKQAKRAHELRLASILTVKKGKEADESKRQLMALLAELTSQLHSGCAEIEALLAEGRYKALDSLSLDSERSKPAAV